MGIIALIVFAIILLYIRFSSSKNRINLFLTGLKDGIFSILKMKNKGWFIFYSVAIWILYISAFYVMMLALPQTSGNSFGLIVIGFVTGSFIITFTNNGFGSYPFVMAAVLSIFGIAKTVGIAFGWMVWTSNILTTVLIGVLSLILMPVYNKKMEK